MINNHQIGMVRVTLPIFRFWNHTHIVGMGKTKHSKFSTQITHGEYYR